MRVFFFFGKGGVGKTTASILSGIRNARMGERSLLVSLDPAHNLGDILKTRLTNRPRKILSHLYAAEIDLQLWISRYLEGALQNIRKTYRYLSAFNLEHHFDILRQAPGLEEHAMLLAFEDLLKGHPETKNLIIDMPPTALTLRFFAAPTLSLLWLGELRRLRREILKKREVITRIKLMKGTREMDPVSRRLDELIARAEASAAFFQEECRLILLINPDEPSRAEGRRILNKMKSLKIPVGHILLNRCADGNDPFDSFEKRPVSKLPVFTPPPIGKEALEDAAKAFPSIFDE